jgi:hypothetical protein
MGLIPRLGGFSPITQMHPELLRMILRSEKEVSPRSINHNGGSSRTLQTCEIQMAYAEWRGRSLRLIIKLKKGEYFPASTLKFDGNVRLQFYSMRHTFLAMTMSVEALTCMHLCDLHV